MKNFFRKLLGSIQPVDDFDALWDRAYAAKQRARELDLAQHKERILQDGGARVHCAANAMTGYGLAINQMVYDGLAKRVGYEQSRPPEYESFYLLYDLTDKGRAMAAMMRDEPTETP